MTDDGEVAPTEGRILRAAMVQTANAYADMPASMEGLGGLGTELVALRQANLVHHAELIERASQAGARVVGLGELFSAPYFALERRALWRDLAEDARTGPSVRFMAELAKRLGVVIIAPIYELDSASGRRFNTAVVIERDGEVLGSYRKNHIPVGENEIAGFSETFYYERGDGQMRQARPAKIHSSNPYFPVFDTTVGRIGVAICYDRHFEGVMAALADAGAEVVFSPAVTFGAQSERMWPLEFAVDAARHRLYIGGSNRLGREPPFEVEYFGESHFVGPAGRLPDRSDDGRLVIADLDLASLSKTDSSGWNLPRDARPDIYRR